MATNSSNPFLPSTRREFLNLGGKGAGLLAFSRFAPSFLVNSVRASHPAPEKDRSILVLVQLAGGNDGLNTVVPFSDPNYYRLRPTLGLPAEQVLKLSDTHGLHPSCAALQRLYGEGKLGIVQNVGYPNPNRSHFRSTEIWETASDSETFGTTGWIGRYLDNACSGAPAAASHDPLAIHLNTLNGEPETLVGKNEHPTFGLSAFGGARKENEENRRLLEALTTGSGNSAGEEGFLKATLMDALVTENKVQKILSGYRSESNYPANPFATSLKNIAALVAAGLPTRVYFVTLNGFDTHYNQLVAQSALLKTLSEGLAAFQSDLVAHKLDGQVTTMTFSEFGRRASENESKGTDHGTASPLFVMGSRVHGGFHGTAPSLNLPKNQDLTYSTDFRQVYSTMLEQWLGAPAAPVLGKAFAKLDLLS
jgi:uncharacterized protein (DUF1501 family)